MVPEIWGSFAEKQFSGPLPPLSRQVHVARIHPPCLPRAPMSPTLWSGVVHGTGSSASGSGSSCIKVNSDGRRLSLTHPPECHGPCSPFPHPPWGPQTPEQQEALLPEPCSLQWWAQSPRLPTRETSSASVVGVASHPHQLPKGVPGQELLLGERPGF